MVRPAARLGALSEDKKERKKKGAACAFLQAWASWSLLGRGAKNKGAAYQEGRFGQRGGGRLISKVGQISLAAQGPRLFLS